MKPAFEDMSLQIPAATAEPEDYTGEDGLLYVFFGLRVLIYSERNRITILSELLNKAFSIVTSVIRIC